MKIIMIIIIIIVTYMKSIRSSGVGNRPPGKKKKTQIPGVCQGGGGEGGGEGGMVTGQIEPCVSLR